MALTWGASIAASLWFVRLHVSPVAARAGLPWLLGGSLALAGCLVAVGSDRRWARVLVALAAAFVAWRTASSVGRALGAFCVLSLGVADEIVPLARSAASRPRCSNAVILLAGLPFVVAQVLRAVEVPAWPSAAALALSICVIALLELRPLPAERMDERVSAWVTFGRRAVTRGARSAWAIASRCAPRPDDAVAAWAWLLAVVPVLVVSWRNGDGIGVASLLLLSVPAAILPARRPDVAWAISLADALLILGWGWWRGEPLVGVVLLAAPIWHRCLVGAVGGSTPVGPRVLFRPWVVLLAVDVAAVAGAAPWFVVTGCVAAGCLALAESASASTSVRPRRGGEGDGATMPARVDAALRSGGAAVVAVLGRILAPAELPTARSAGRPRRWEALFPVAVWLAMATLMVQVQTVSYLVGRAGTPFSLELLASWRFDWYWGKSGYDADNLRAIAATGYGFTERLYAYNPAFPLATRYLARLTSDFQSAAVLVSLASGLTCHLLFWAWMRERGLSLQERRVCQLLFACYPGGFVLYGVGYSDGLGLVFVLAALVLAERGAFTAAGVMGAGATFARPNAVVLIPALLALGMEYGHGLGGHRVRELARWAGEHRLRARAALLSCCGIGAYSVWCWLASGDPLKWWTVEHTSFKHPSLASIEAWFKLSALRSSEPPWSGPHGFLLQTLSAVVVIGALALSPTVSRRLGVGYGILVAGSAAAVWLTAPWFSPGAREMLPAIPAVLLIVGRWAAHRRVPRAALLATSFTLVVVLASKYAAQPPLSEVGGRPLLW